MSNLGDYFKEKELSDYLTPKGWFIIRLDGKAFHTYTNKLQKPFDSNLSEAMCNTTKQLCSEIQNVKLAYTQSDEISLILSDLDSKETSLWYGGNIQKISSVSASIATAHFNRNFKHIDGKLAYFDSRVFKLDNEDDIQKYLIWRQEDAIKNAITLIASKYYSPKQLHEKHSGDKIQMIEEKKDSVSNYHEGLIKGFSIKKVYRKVPFQNPKTKESGFIDRSFWQESAIDFKKEEFQSLIFKFLK